jgi:hypothetical protein
MSLAPIVLAIVLVVFSCLSGLQRISGSNQPFYFKPSVPHPIVLANNIALFILCGT